MENEQLEPQGSVQLTESNRIQDPEWCFQFFDNEPVVIGWQDESVEGEPSPLVMQIQPIEGESMLFRQNGMTFKIFAREITEETKLQRAKSKENDVR